VFTWGVAAAHGQPVIATTDAANGSGDVARVAALYDPATRVVCKYVDFGSALNLAFTAPSAFVAFNASHFEPYLRSGDTPTPTAAGAPTTLRCPVAGCTHVAAGDTPAKALAEMQKHLQQQQRKTPRTTAGAIHHAGPANLLWAGLAECPACDKPLSVLPTCSQGRSPFLTHITRASDGKQCACHPDVTTASARCCLPCSASTAARAASSPAPPTWILHMCLSHGSSGSLMGLWVLTLKTFRLKLAEMTLKGVEQNQ
jgi:hypothetical protein